jgi:hypothetical protein
MQRVVRLRRRLRVIQLRHTLPLLGVGSFGAGSPR